MHSAHGLQRKGAGWAGAAGLWVGAEAVAQPLGVEEALDDARRIHVLHSQPVGLEYCGLEEEPNGQCMPLTKAKDNTGRQRTIFLLCFFAAVRCEAWAIWVGAAVIRVGTYSVWNTVNTVHSPEKALPRNVAPSLRIVSAVEPNDEMSLSP